MPENRELGGYTKVKENSVGDTVVVKKDLLGRTVDKTVIDPKEETWSESLVHKADQTIKDVAHRLEHKTDTTNTVVLDKDIPKKTKGTIQNSIFSCQFNRSITFINSTNDVRITEVGAPKPLDAEAALLHTDDF
jgi:hypothetical protein